MKRESKIISCFLVLFLVFEMIMPMDFSEKVFADSLLRGSISKSQTEDMGTVDKPQTELPDNYQGESDTEGSEQFPGENPGDMEKPDEEVKSEETPNEPEVDGEEDSVIKPEDDSKNENQDSKDFEEELKPGVLEGGVLDEPITSWAFSGVEDLNNDGIIDEKDLSLVASRYNALRGQGNYNSNSDFNNDGTIDLFDLVRTSTKIGTKGKIVIDPGHGGKDPGAVGPTGLQEKDIVLKVAFKVRDLLQSYGYTVIMTRTTDIYLTLQERCDIANNNEADLFVSIHNNSFSDPTANGTETFSYSPNDKGGQVAKSIQGKLISALGLRDRGHKTSDFYVLRNTKMPAALTELAFISNPREESLLKTDNFQTKAARAIVDGILGI